VVDESTGCWIWQRSRTPLGYGQIRIKGRLEPGHRHFYEKANGSIPKGVHLHHVCSNPACVNPDHLSPEVPTSHARIHAKLDKDAVIAIRRLLAMPDRLSHKEIGGLFGVTKMTVADIAANRSWKDVPADA
jgi:hypothetical protein